MDQCHLVVLIHASCGASHFSNAHQARVSIHAFGSVSDSLLRSMSGASFNPRTRESVTIDTVVNLDQDHFNPRTHKVRPSPRSRLSCATGFNPRSRERPKGYLDPAWEEVSIHAPMRARPRLPVDRLLAWYFNPRTHEGGDRRFNPH
jgi:hypothetical protein